MKQLPENKPIQKLLTQSLSRNSLLLTLFWASLCGYLSFDGFDHGHTIPGWFFCIGALCQLLNMPSLLRRHRHIKRGGEVYVLEQSSIPLPKVISVTVTGLLTILGAIGSVSMVFIIHANFNTLFGWTICLGVLLALWLFIGYCWYRIFTEKAVAKLVAGQEQSEDAWPPPPIRAGSDDWDYPERTMS